MEKPGRLIFAASVALLLHVAALLAPQPFRPRSMALPLIPEVHLAPAAKPEKPEQATAQVHSQNQAVPSQTAIAELSALPLPAAESATGQTSSINTPVTPAATFTGTTPPVTAPSAAAAPSRPPVCLREPKPAMPMLSRTLGETGKVRLRLRVDEAGRKSVELLERSGYSRLDAAALAAVRQWPCQPALNNGLAIAAELDELVVFELQ